MERSVKVCDNPGCGKTEEKGNHWYRLYILAGMIIVSRVGQLDMTSLTKSDPEPKDACGRKCVAEMVTAWMGEGDPT